MSKKTGFTVTLESKQLEAQIKKALARNPEVTTKKVTSILLNLANKSAKMAPVDTGDLRNDCMAELNGVTIFARKTHIANVKPTLKASGSVSYDLPYAVRQHEELGYKHPRGGEAKFLEKPFEQNLEKYVTSIHNIPEEVIK